MTEFATDLPMTLAKNYRFACLAIIAVMGGCDSESPKPISAPIMSSHQKMLATLEEIRRNSLTDNEYFETSSIQHGNQMLAEFEPDNDQAHFEINWQMGTAELRLGHEEKGIEHLKKAQQLVPEFRKGYGDEKYGLLLRDLAIGYLRLAERQNCVNCVNGESCLFPIRSTGVHLKQEGASTAIEYLNLLLAEAPDNLSARWLLNIAYMTLGKYPEQVPDALLIPQSAFESSEEFPRFSDVSLKLGLKTVNCSGGAVADDFDADGDIDLLTSTWAPGGQIRYFENTGGTFEDRSEVNGLTGLFSGLNMVQGDYDNDGDVDVFVLRGAWLKSPAGDQPNSLLENDGHGAFRDVTFEVGLGDSNHPTQSATWVDFDNDGDLDLYIGNENTASQLFQNNGDRTFTDIAATAKVENKRFAKGVIAGDFDNDDYPDLYVSNLGSTNRLYRNNGNGTFSDVARKMNVHGPVSSFPVWFWDFDNDCSLDLFVPSYHADVRHVAEDYLGLRRTDSPDRLYRKVSEGFDNVATITGVTRATQPMGCNFGDLDNDGFLDFYLGTGYVDYTGLMPNLMFRNQGGERFVDVTTAGGFGHLQKGHGIAWADFDADGDLDIFAQMGGANPGDAFGNVLFENPGFDNHWLAVKLVGTRSNVSAIGARLTATISTNDKKRTIHRRVNSGGSFGANPLRQHLGLGTSTEVETLEVYWPTSKLTQRFENLKVDQFIEIHEGEDTVRQREYLNRPFPEDVSEVSGDDQ